MVLLYNALCTKLSLLQVIHLVGCKYRISWRPLSRVLRPLPNKCPRYNTKQHLMVRLQSWGFGKYGVNLHSHYSKVHLTWIGGICESTIYKLNKTVQLFTKSFNQRGDISTLKGGLLKLVDKFTYQGSSVSWTETDINVSSKGYWSYRSQTWPIK